MLGSRSNAAGSRGAATGHAGGGGCDTLDVRVGMTGSSSMAILASAAALRSCFFGRRLLRIRSVAIQVRAPKGSETFSTKQSEQHHIADVDLFFIQFFFGGVVFRRLLRERRDRSEDSPGPGVTTVSARTDEKGFKLLHESLNT